MIKAITFDLDMTLIDFLKFKKLSSDAAAKAMVKAGLKMSIIKCKNELYEFYRHDMEGNRVFNDFLRFKNGYSERILAAGINAYIKTKYSSIKAYPGVKKTLSKLKKKGIKLAIVTDAPRLKAYMRLDAIGIADYFDTVVGQEDTGRTKPSKLPFKKALKNLGVKASETMHVGDWPDKDILGAKNTGMKTCFARYGYQWKGKIVYADYKIQKVEEMVDIIDDESKHRV